MLSLTKISFGGTSAIVTSIGLIVGLTASGASRGSVIAALLIFALGDNLTDALSIHIYQESERLESRRAFAATVGNFVTRVAICAGFLALVSVLPSGYAVGVSLLWGAVLLAGLSWLVARSRGANPPMEVRKHLAVAFGVIALSRMVGSAILGMSVP